MRALSGLLTLFLCQGAAALTEFSADITYYDREMATLATGRIYVSDLAIREERQKGARREVRITDLFQGTTTILDPQRGEYQVLQELLVLPRNPLRFCADSPLLICEFERREQVDGRQTERWRAGFGVAGFDITITAWYDPLIQYPTRLQLERGEWMQLSNIEIGRLPSKWFSLPFDSSQVERVEGVGAGPFSVLP